MSRLIDLTGMQFGNWTILSRGSSSRSGCTRWRCRCSCGRISLVNGAHLTQNRSTSCGCVRNRKSRALQFRGCGDIHLGVYTRMRNRALGYGGRKPLEFTVTIEYLWALFLAQDRRCAISGLPIQFASTLSSKDQHQGTASLDRVDNARGYTPGNVQWVHKHINYMKRTYAQDYFIEMCHAVAQHNGE